MLEAMPLVTLGAVIAMICFLGGWWLSQKTGETDLSKLEDAVANLVAKVEETRGVAQSAVVMIQGLPAVVTAAVTAALEAEEATDDAIAAAVDAATTALDGAADDLQAALDANAPPADPVDPPADPVDPPADPADPADPAPPADQ